MEFKSKYELNEEVFFNNQKLLKIEKGVISGFNCYKLDSSKEQWIYYIKPIREK